MPETTGPLEELTCAVIGGKAYDVIEIKASDGGWYDYNAKYAAGGSVHELPANLKENIYHFVQESTLKAHKFARTALVYLDEGKILATAGWDRTVKLWKLGPALPES